MLGQQVSCSPQHHQLCHCCNHSPVLNPQPRGISWPTSESPFTLFLLTWFSIVLRLVLYCLSHPSWRPTFSLNPSLEPLRNPISDSFHNRLHLLALPEFSVFLDCHSKSEQMLRWTISKLSHRRCHQGELSVMSWVKVMHTFWLHSGWKASLL